MNTLLLLLLFLLFSLAWCDLKNKHSSAISNDAFLYRPCIKVCTNMKTLSCREAGFECDYIVRGETEEEILKNGAEHAKKEHNIKEEELTPEFNEKLKGLIRNA